MQRLVILGLVGAMSIVATAQSAHAQGATRRAFVLDQHAKSVTTVAVASGAALQTATVQGSPTTLLRTTDGKRLLVLDRGDGEDEDNRDGNVEEPLRHVGRPGRLCWCDS